MTKWSFEVPIPHLDDFHEDQDYIFTLNHLYSTLANPMAEQYRIYVNRCIATGLVPIWLDNSYNEKMQADSTHELGYTARGIRAAKVVSPDSPKWSTEQILLAYHRLKTENIGDEQIICVVSSMGMWQTIRSKIGIKTYAVSYWTRADWMFDDLLEIRHCSNLHYLGFLNPEEITAVQPHSCDTSMPIKLALQNETFEHWCVRGCPHINTKDLGLYGSDFFQRKMTDNEIKLAKSNIKCLKEVCK